MIKYYVKKAFNFAKNLKIFNGLQIFWRKTSGSSIKNENILNKELAEESHKPIIRNSNKEKIHLLLTIFGVQI